MNNIQSVQNWTGYKIYNRSDFNAFPYHGIITLQTAILHTKNIIPLFPLCCTEQEVTASYTTLEGFQKLSPKFRYLKSSLCMMGFYSTES